MKTPTSLSEIKTAANRAATEASAAATRAAELREAELQVKNDFEQRLVNCWTWNERLRAFLKDAALITSELETRPATLAEKVDAVAGAVNFRDALLQVGLADQLLPLVDATRADLEKTVQDSIAETIAFCDLHGFKETAGKLKKWLTHSPSTRGMSGGAEYDITAFPMK